MEGHFPRDRFKKGSNWDVFSFPKDNERKENLFNAALSGKKINQTPSVEAAFSRKEGSVYLSDTKDNRKGLVSEGDQKGLHKNYFSDLFNAKVSRSTNISRFRCKSVDLKREKKEKFCLAKGGCQKVRENFSIFSSHAPFLHFARHLLLIVP